MKLKKILILVLLFCSFTQFLFGDLKINLEISAKGKKKIPVILNKFLWEGADSKSIANKIQNIIKKDLIFSDDITLNGSKPEFSINGEVSIVNNRINFKLRVTDLFLQKDNLIKIYTGSENVISKIAHAASNDILQIITGEKGIFEYKILFVSDKTGKKQIYLMDYDGNNVKRLTFDNSIDTAPELFDDYLMYTSFKFGNPRVVLKYLPTGEIKLLIKKGTMSAGADISPDKKKIVAMYGTNKNTDIGLFNFNGKFLKAIMPSIFDEASPRWNHKGDKIAFISDRTGSPQVYIYDLNTNKMRRISFGSRYSCYPCWGANDEYIYYSSLKGDTYTIYRTSLNYFHLEELTQGEYPDVSKNNKYMVFTKQVNGFYQIFIMNLETNKIFQITTDNSNKYFPRWYYGKY